MHWIDNHCHLPPGDGGDPLVEQAREAGVTTMITVGTTAESSQQCIDVAARHEGVWATVGVHPHDATEGVDGLLPLISAPKVVAIGEAGLDYYYEHSPRDIQRQAFEAQIALAHEHGLPLVIHTRDAWDDTFEVLDRVGMPTNTVFHCFTGGPAEAEAGLERGAKLSISGIVTFKSATDLQEAVRITPLSSLMVETDSPYLTPEPHRGQKNRPALVALVGKKVAQLHGIPPSAVATATTATARAFYDLDRHEAAWSKEAVDPA